MQTTYLSAAETAKLIRAALKKNFPGTKFSVRSRSYAGGASIDIDWTDGPSELAVKPITGQYRGSEFDGMIDMKVSLSSWLMPDGSACVASHPGTTGSMGVIPAQREWMPHPDAKLVHFGADHVFTRRRYTVALMERCKARLASKGYPTERVTVTDSDYFGAGFTVNDPRPRREMDHDMERLMHEAIHRTHITKAGVA